MAAADMTDAMEVLFSRTAQDLIPHSLIRRDFFRKSGKDPQMADLQDEIFRAQLQAFRRQQKHFRQAPDVNSAGAFQTDLRQLPESVLSRGDPVDIFVIIQLPQLSGEIPAILDDGKRHVRLQCHQAAVRIRERDH